MAIKAITEEMAKHIVGIGQDDIKKKIKTLRTPSFFYFCLSGKQMQQCKQGVTLHCCALFLPYLLADCREVFDAT